MKYPLFKALCGLSLMVLCHCGGGGGTDDCCSDNTPSSSVCAETTTWTSSIALATAASVVTSATQDYNLTASANKKIAAYLINESSIEPSGTDSGWTSITQATDLSTTNISHVLADTADGAKTVYAWFKDECGDVSPSSNTAFILDVTAPAGTLSLDSGAKFTLESDLDVTAALSATDADGIVAYALTDANAEPEVDSTDWVSVASTTSLSINTTRTLLQADRANTIYGWVKDVAGHVSAVSDEIEVMRFFRDTGPTGHGTYASIAVDSSNTAYFSAYNATNGILNVNYQSISLADAIDNARIDPSVGTAGDLGKGTSIAIDINDKIHVAYRDEGNGKLKYATNASGAWVLTTIEDGGRSPNIAIDSQGFIHIVHQDDEDVTYVTNASGAWVSTNIYFDSNYNIISETVKMTMDQNDNLHVVYIDSDNDDLKYLTNQNGSWVSESVYSTIAEPFDWPHIAMNGTTVVITYTNEFGKFIYAEKPQGGGWQNFAQIEPLHAFPSTVLADLNGAIHIVYFMTGNQDLKYASNATGSWLYQTLDTSTAGGTYAFPSMVVDSNDRLHLAYYDLDNTVLVYATTADAL